MAHLFISYSKQDIDFVRYLRALLEAEDFAVWLDEARLTPSTRWWKDIERNIDSCGAFIVVMSPDAYNSDWVEREILRAEKQRRPIYPVLLAGEPWSRLANIQYEDLRAGLRAKLSKRFLNSLRKAIGPARAPEILFNIEQGDITTFDADVVALKYTQKHHGAARVIALKLIDEAEVEPPQVSPEDGSSSLVNTEGVITPRKALFVGMPRISEVGYEGIRAFASDVLSILLREAPATRHLSMTIHGANAGLDETETLLAQFGGYMDALRARKLPPLLEQITLVEYDGERAKRMRATLETYLAKEDYARRTDAGWGYSLTAPAEDDEDDSRIEAAGAVSETRPYAFVAMPNDPAMDDLYYYAIQGAVHAQGMLCVRIEKERFTEDVLEQAKQRIESANVVIVELSQPDPNVYMQLGYAWGKGRPMILLAKNADALQFDTQACLTYQTIKGLEAALMQVLQEMRVVGGM